MLDPRIADLLFGPEKSFRAVRAPKKRSRGPYTPHQGARECARRASGRGTDATWHAAAILKARGL